MDGALRSVESELAAVVDQQSSPASEESHRAGLIIAILDARVAILTAVTSGVHQGIQALSKTDRRPSSNWWPLLEFAASVAIAGAAGPIAVVIGKGFAGLHGKKAVEDSVKEALKKAGKASLPAPGKADHLELVDSFTRVANHKLLASRMSLTSSVSVIYDALSIIPIEKLEQLAKHLVSEPLESHPAIVSQAAMSTIVAWTNFLARATYGAMGVWDPWETNGGHGAKALQGAAHPPTGADERSEVTAGNVEPRSLYAVNDADQGDQMGILEVDIDLYGELVESNPMIGESRGMRLENVGPRVRKELRSLGTVRAAPVNKLIRVFDTADGFVRQAGAILITADGYVRSFDLGSATRAHTDVRPPTVKELLGLEQRRYRVHEKANEALLRTLAERAQDLPLSKLEG